MRPLRTNNKSVKRTTVTDRKTIIFGLGEIASNIQWWLDFNKKDHESEGCTVTGDTNIIAIPAPSWPGRAQMELWIKTIRDAATELGKS